MSFDIHNWIIEAKLGSARKDAQEDTCSVFAAALFDLLTERGVAAEMFCVCQPRRWAHSVVKVGDKFYDSKGEFSEDIWRQRAKIHPSVKTSLEFAPDLRDGVFDDEFDGLYAFYVKALKKALLEYQEPPSFRAKKTTKA